MSNYFDGAGYQAELDFVRLTGQMERIYNLMQDGEWRTLQQISKATNSPESSASAQLRNFRKPRFGSFIVNRKRVVGGLWAYQLKAGN